MEHLKALALKFLGTLLLIYVVLGIVFNYSFVHILTLSLLLGVISYLLGDLLLLPRTSNTVATFSDFALALLFTWFYLANVTNTNTLLFLASLLTASGVALLEAFFHRYLMTKIIKDSSQTIKRNKTLHYQTETSEELTPERSRLENIDSQKQNDK